LAPVLIRQRSSGLLPTHTHPLPGCPLRWKSESSEKGQFIVGLGAGVDFFVGKLLGELESIGVGFGKNVFVGKVLGKIEGIVVGAELDISVGKLFGRFECIGIFAPLGVKVGLSVVFILGSRFGSFIPQQDSPQASFAPVLIRQRS